MTLWINTNKLTSSGIETVSEELKTLLFSFSTELFRTADLFPMFGAARVWLVWRSKQHRKGPVHGGFLPGTHEEAGKTGSAEPVSWHEPGARQLPKGQRLWVGLHSLSWWVINFLAIFLKLQIMCCMCVYVRGCCWILTVEEVGNMFLAWIPVSASQCI